jgi:hypothetical protein
LQAPDPGNIETAALGVVAKQFVNNLQHRLVLKNVGVVAPI